MGLPASANQPRPPIAPLQCVAPLQRRLPVNRYGLTFFPPGCACSVLTATPLCVSPWGGLNKAALEKKIIGSKMLALEPLGARSCAPEGASYYLNRTRFMSGRMSTCTSEDAEARHALTLLTTQHNTVKRWTGSLGKRGLVCQLARTRSKQNKTTKNRLLELHTHTRGCRKTTGELVALAMKTGYPGFSC